MSAAEQSRTGIAAAMLLLHTVLPGSRANPAPVHTVQDRQGKSEARPHDYLSSQAGQPTRRVLRMSRKDVKSLSGFELKEEAPGAHSIVPFADTITVLYFNI